jgi:hypothetical protein
VNGSTKARSAPAAVAVAAALLILLAAQAALEARFERRWPRRPVENLLYIPAGRHLDYLSLGFRGLYADVLWMRAIGYFGAHALTDGAYPWLYHILDQVTTLDPAFRFPYYFGGITLAVAAERAEESVRILEKGMVRYPGDWRFPFYAGFDCFYYLQDPARAAAFMNVAASLPRAPAYLPRLAASLMVESGRVPAAIRFLETMAEEARDEGVREEIRAKIAKLRAGEVPDSLRRFLAGERAP